MDTYTIYMMALAIGAFGGIVHQFVDRTKLNDYKAFLRGGVVGAFAALLSVLLIPLGSVPVNVFYITAATSGFMGDSIILNIVERELKTIEKS